MKLMEYMGRELWYAYGIPCLQGTVLDRQDDQAAVLNSLMNMGYPCMLKAQVETGGRGKAGGIRTADSPEQALSEVRELFDLTIKGFPVRKVYAVQRAEITDEWYLSILLDRDKRCPVLIFSPHGGMDIEEAAAQHPEDIVRLEIDPMIGFRADDFDGAAVPAALKPPLRELAANLYRLFREKDALLVEINPLGVTPEGGLTALDAKVVIDDSALDRQEDIRVFRDSLDEDPLVVEARKCRFLYIPIEAGGRVAVMSNGSGMIMSCIDLLSKESVSVGAVLDLGGGATTDRVTEGIGIVFKNPDIRVLFVNIFGGITRCDEIAGGIIGALKHLDPACTLVARMEGTHKEEGLAMLEPAGDRVVQVDNIREGVAAVKERMGAA